MFNFFRIISKNKGEIVHNRNSAEVENSVRAVTVPTGRTM